MSGRNLRESTKKVTEVQKEKTKVVEELITLKNTSKALENIRPQEEKSYSAAALELVEYTVEHLESDSKDTSEESAVDTVNVGADSDVFADYIEEVPVNEDWLDPLGVEKTPKESPGPKMNLTYSFRPIVKVLQLEATGKKSQVQPLTYPHLLHVWRISMKKVTRVLFRQNKKRLV